ncbi:MAG: transcriptional regulator, AraC family [Steroidobacteraceae bacterium]|nr:transcriptional regulator, AraC family [Steroidobacteraceae bacterium]
MDYQEHPAPASLSRHFACVWRLTDPAPRAGIQTIYPDGRCELIAHLATRPRIRDPVRGWHEQSTTLYAAQRVTALQLEATGALDDFGVRLRPAASAIIAREIEPLRDRVVDLASLDPRVSVSLIDAARAFARGDAAPLWRLLERLAAAFPIDAKIEDSVARIESSGGGARIDSLARAAGWSVRTLQTRFLAAVGLTPKEFARVLRLQATLRALGGDSPLAELACDAGFADQAHATRELKRVTGLTPARLREELRRDQGSSTAIEIAAAFVRGHS